MNKYIIFIGCMLAAFLAQGMSTMSRLTSCARIGSGVSRVVTINRAFLHDVTRLKGTVKALKDKSPFWGALAFANGSLDKFYADKGKIGNATRLFFYENPADRIIACSKCPDGLPTALSSQLVAKLLQAQESEGKFNEDSFVAEWYEAYKRLPLEHISESNFKKKARRFLRDFLKNSEKGSSEISSLLLAFLYKKAQDHTEILSFATALNSSLISEGYTRKDLADCEDFFTSTKLTEQDMSEELVEKMVFWLLKRKEDDTSCSFLRTPWIGIYEDRAEGHNVCAEETLRTLVNYILYNPLTQTLDLSLLPAEVQKQCQEKQPAFYAFIQKYNDPKEPGYYEASALEWFYLLADIPGILYSGKNCVVQANIDQNARLLYYLFGFSMSSDYTQLGAFLSTERRKLEFRKKTVDAAVASVMLSLEDQSCLAWQKNITAFFQTEIGRRHAYIPTPHEEMVREGASLQVIKNIRRVEAFSGKELLPLYTHFSVVDYVFREIDFPTISLERFHELLKEYAVLSTPYLNGFSSLGRNLLHESIKQRREDLIDYLVAAGVDASIENNSGETIMHTAAIESSAVILKKILALKKCLVRKPNKDGLTPLQCLLESKPTWDRAEKIQMLVEAGADSNKEVRRDGATALHLAAAEGNESLVAFLLEHGADPRLKNCGGMSPFSYALLVAGNIVVARVLKNAGADIQEKDEDDNTVLHVAASLRDDDETLVRFCIEMGMDLYATTKHGETALMLAVQQRNERVAHFLLEAGLDINHTDINGETVLLRAVQSGDSQAVLLSLVLNVDIHSKNNEGKTALDIAQEKGYSEIVELLKDEALKKASL